MANLFNPPRPAHKLWILRYLFRSLSKEPCLAQNQRGQPLEQNPERSQFTPATAATRDPIPRMLLFSEHDLNSVRTRTDYQALREGTRSPSNYTIDRVAKARGLKVQSNPTVSSWFASRKCLAEFIEDRVDQKEPKDPEGFRREFQKLLTGNHIIGSKTVDHFMNLKIDAEQGYLRSA
jgi:hypothetical protein